MRISLCMVKTSTCRGAYIVRVFAITITPASASFILKGKARCAIGVMWKCFMALWSCFIKNIRREKVSGPAPGWLYQPFGCWHVWRSGALLFGVAPVARKRLCLHQLCFWARSRHLSYALPVWNGFILVATMVSRLWGPRPVFWTPPLVVRQKFLILLTEKL